MSKQRKTLGRPRRRESRTKISNELAKLIQPGQVDAIARKLDVHKSTVYRWMQGKGKPDAAQWQTIQTVFAKLRK